MKIQIRTDNFKSSHGKAPRGRGQWNFQIGRPSNGGFMFMARCNSTWTEAQKEARQVAEEAGAHFIELLA